MGLGHPLQACRRRGIHEESRYTGHWRNSLAISPALRAGRQEERGPGLTDDAATGLARDGLGAVNRRAVDTGAIGEAATALLEVRLRVDALKASRGADFAGDLTRGADLGGTLAGAGTGRSGQRAEKRARRAEAWNGSQRSAGEHAPGAAESAYGMRRRRWCCRGIRSGCRC